MRKGSLWFSQRARFHKGERESIYQCMPTILILTLISFWLFSFFPSHSFLFLFPSFSFQIPISSLRFPLFTVRPFFIVPAVTEFYCLALNLLCLVWVYWPTITIQFVCHPPSPDKEGYFVCLAPVAPLSCYGLGSFSLPIPHSMHLMVPTQLASFG